MNIFLALFTWLGQLLHWLRVGVLNLLTLLVLAVIGAALFQATRHPAVPDDAALIAAPSGSLVYSSSIMPWQSVVDELSGRGRQEVLLRHLVAAIDRSAADPRIRLLALNLGRFNGGSLPQLETVAKALRRFRQAGKSIYVYAPNYSQGDYLLAAQANYIYLPPLGAVMIAGYADDHLYFKGLLSKLGIKVTVFRKGKYKSAVEPFIRENMSTSAKTENRAWLNVWWQTYVDTVAEGRGLAPAKIRFYAENLPQLLEQVNGNASQLAKQQGLVTVVGDYRQFRKAVATALDQQPDHLRAIDYRHYFAATRPRQGSRSIIAVVPIDGMLLTGGRAVPGAVMAEATVRQLDRLRREANVKAVILQVNSPGGSVDAAEAIRRAVVRLRKAGKPVVVSMGTLGASGAYWLSTAANQIYAQRTTITADIGVFALYPDFSGTLTKLGIGYSGVATTANANALMPFRPLSPKIGQSLQAVVDHLYTRFVTLVAQARHLPLAQAEQVAQGRAWSGEAALRLKLIDHLGGLQQAIIEVAHLAKLPEKAYRVNYLPRSPGYSIVDWLRPRIMLGTLLSLEPVEWTAPGLPRAPLRNIQLLLDQAHSYGFFSYGPMAPQT